MELFGIIAGIILIIGAVGNLSRMPWQFSPDGFMVPAFQIIGSIGMIVIGVFLLWLVIKVDG